MLNRLLHPLLLPALVAVCFLLAALPAPGGTRPAGPSPKGVPLSAPAPALPGQGCLLVFEDPNTFTCIGDCLQGGVCSRQALIIERIDGTQILSCGNNCLGGDCRLHYIVRPDGLLLMACEVLNCSYCSVDSNERRCLCEG